MQPPYTMQPYTINDYLNEHGIFKIEGYTEHPRHIHDLIQLVQNPSIRTIIEIGFNAGHSAELFLKHNPMVTMISFDIGEHEYVSIAKKYIDMTYPNRHSLIIGDSTIQLPDYISKHNISSDIIFIDGGHTYDIAKSDLENSRSFAHENTIVIMDDTIYRKEWIQSWNIGPSCVWEEKKQEGMIIELGHSEYSIGEGMSWGKYKRQ
jgi:predicted O-methyltransferase YrrM